MNARRHLLQGTLFVALVAASALAASPAQAIPENWSEPNAHCTHAAGQPDWCSGTIAPRSADTTLNADEPWPRGGGLAPAGEEYWPMSGS